MNLGYASDAGQLLTELCLFSCSTWNFHVVTVVRYGTAEQSRDGLSMVNLVQQVNSVRSHQS